MSTMTIDNTELLRLKQLATDSLIKYVGDEESYRLAQALETALESVEDYDSMVDKVAALEEENDMLRSDADEMKETLKEVLEAAKENVAKLQEQLK